MAKKNIDYSNCKPCCITINNKVYSFKSRMEAIFALYLEDMRKSGKVYKWEYETDIFRFECERTAKVKQYNPDFKVWKNANEFEFIECKGKMCQADVRKKSLMQKQFPNIAISYILGDSAEFAFIRNEYYTQLIDNIYQTPQTFLGSITPVSNIWKSNIKPKQYTPKTIKKQKYL